MPSNIKEAFNNRGMISGRMISASKTGYREKFPDHEVYFNANIFVLGEGKVWYGDLDINRDREALSEIAAESGVTLYIVSEMDGRFDKEDLNDSDILKVSICTIKP
jgi:hypothetical protein